MNINLNNRLIYIIIILIISNSVILYNYYKGSSNTYKLNNKSNSASQDLLSANFGSLITQNEGVAVDKNAELINLKNENLTLNQLLLYFDNRIIFRFSSLDCSVCIQRIFNVINSFPKDVQAAKFAIIYDGDSFRNFDIKFNDINTLVPAYIISPESENYVKGNFLNIPVEGKGMPFFFSLNALGETDNIYIPDENKPDFTKNYLTFLLRKFDQTKTGS
ncbi:MULTISPECIES: hypothetical protein [unclassified Sphingobacterium]|uniref:hypothetical protein n=1 Tax=unclassified Sphingobacterium TaxID=2609468 RepID=UPI00104C9E09|nr:MULTISPECIES: hypothetical protein [unclassified Sphingobacterium]MCS3556215.1 hypothetical protein [Sphingobacterium sp. JUb21]TCR08587.1 hypothetical protein EDF66_103134 [Sphingobacterium sp. JUb20]